MCESKLEKINLAQINSAYLMQNNQIFLSMHGQYNDILFLFHIFPWFVALLRHTLKNIEYIVPNLHCVISEFNETW